LRGGGKIGQAKKYTFASSTAHVGGWNFDLGDVCHFENTSKLFY
jgi:hypothetical protein